MNLYGHTLAALAITPVTLLGVEPNAYASLAILGSLSGCNAPDYLEFNFIKHRTITHVLSIWVCIALYGLCLSRGYHCIDYFNSTHLSELFGLFLWGYGLGGVSHWLGDLPNKQAIPVLTPYDRVSLNWFNSGEYQNATSAVIFVLSLLTAYSYAA